MQWPVYVTGLLLLTHMKSLPGSYALLFHCDDTVDIDVGALGQLNLQPGFYVYVGSAFGTGGVAARVTHHCQISQRPHWHLDYLRPHLRLLEIWCTYDTVRREHQWVGQLAGLRGARQPYPGFGASDCGCCTHLFRFGYKPSFTGFRHRMREQESGHKRLYLEKITT